MPDRKTMDLGSVVVWPRRFEHQRLIPGPWYVPDKLRTGARVQGSVRGLYLETGLQSLAGPALRRKLQAASRKLDWHLELCYRIIKEKVMRESKYSFLYQAHDGSIMRPESFLNINKGRTLSSSQLRMLGITKIKNKNFKRQAASVKLDR